MYKYKNTDNNIILSAFGIHSGGGLILLEALIKGLKGSLKAASFDIRFIADVFSISSDVDVDYVRRSFVARILSLFRLSSKVALGDTLLCFNSLPPLIKSKGRVIVFVHAPHFVGAHRGITYTKLTALRLEIERVWFKLGIANCDEIWVQTEVMQDAMRSQYPYAVIKVVPLVDESIIQRLAVLPVVGGRPKADASQFTFFYPADAVGHKNHENLLKAWSLLAQQNRRPILCLTLRPAELKLLEERTQLDPILKISLVNLGWVSRSDVLKKLSQSSALIFPSRAETFGLPMLEARSLGIPVVASERDFVRDVCIPIQTFDPDSPRSIAMAVLRFMDGEASIPTQYYSADRFVKSILS